MAATSPWAPSRDAADYLQVSERTLLRWRDSGLLQPGRHYRRKFPAVNSPLLYQLQACEQAMTEAFARDPRTLELANG
jgi:predicted site-specific integrase-resolvase